jgi:hypothetical protein
MGPYINWKTSILFIVKTRQKYCFDTKKNINYKLIEQATDITYDPTFQNTWERFFKEPSEPGCAFYKR